MPDTDIRVQLESLTKDIENINNIQSRLDTAIDKLTDVSTSIKSMLAVHEEKISRQEQIDDIIFGKLKERENEIDKVHRELTKEIQQKDKQNPQPRLRRGWGRFVPPPVDLVYVFVDCLSSCMSLCI